MYQSNVINGKDIASNIRSKLSQNIIESKAKYNSAPCLAIISIIISEASHIYIRNKIHAAKMVGITILELKFDHDVTTDVVMQHIIKLNDDNTISGIIVQLPAPDHININSIITSINPMKDVDGFHPLNIGYLHHGSFHGFVPCTALACLKLLKHIKHDIRGMHAVIVSRSNIVGKPLSALLLHEHCTVTIAHSYTQNLSLITSSANIVIVGIGKASFFTADYFNNNAIAIDVGINRCNDKITGDIDFKNVQNKVRYITPVPNGVGPLTVAFLLCNTYNAFLLQRDACHKNQNVLYNLY